MGFLTRLRHDTRGAAAVMMAVMVVPLLLFVGSAVDVARVYTVRSRLQQACDAGVLAGKSAMTDLTYNGVLDATATKAAKDFFANNFWSGQDPNDLTKPGPAGWMQTVAAPDPANKGKYLPVFVPSKTSELRVAGVATVQVPMAIMRIFAFKPIVVQATCEARYETDADIMIVLDQTGSMACYTSDDEATCKSWIGGHVVADPGNTGTYSVTEKTGGTGSRIEGLRQEVITFYNTITAQADKSTNFRFGFVPYTAAANVGYLLDKNYLKKSANYDTRTLKAGTSNQWIYNTVALNTTNFVTGTSYANAPAIDNPAQSDATTTKWLGCVEERLDASSNLKTSFDPASPPLDLDPDKAPATAADGWAPWWPDVTFARTGPGDTTTTTARTYYSRPNGGNGTYYDQIGQAFNEIDCPLVAKRIGDPVKASNGVVTLQMALPGNTDTTARENARVTLRQTIQDYLKSANGFTPYGTTYHDVGMKWGLRLISPTGMFANDTKAWPARNPPNRFIVFLTDGDMETDPNRINSGPTGDGMAYSEYGMETFARRVGNGATGDALDTYHSARFLAECQMAKNRNIKVFVIAYAQVLTSDLKTCASPNQAYYAKDQTNLNAAFTAIAKQVAMLRLSK